MTISVPLTSSATKHNAVIQCVTRTVALWRGALVRAVTEPTRLRFQTVPAIGQDTTTLTSEADRGDPITRLGSCGDHLPERHEARLTVRSPACSPPARLHFRLQCLH